eukprot:GHVU01170208.1.p1 GENE.GHVU01170208.1~~GHVU01170208.1.p1  ORF type:complete len:138 (-),score=3.09 GHVU01170208.1:121-534(-)
METRRAQTFLFPFPSVNMYIYVCLDSTHNTTNKLYRLPALSCYIFSPGLHIQSPSTINLYKYLHGHTVKRTKLSVCWRSHTTYTRTHSTQQSEIEIGEHAYTQTHTHELHSSMPVHTRIDAHPDKQAHVRTEACRDK